MLPAFVHRLILAIAQCLIQSLIHCSCFLADQFNVHSDHTYPPERNEEDILDRASPKKSRQACVDVFENPCFISTDYKDDRAAVKLAKISSHLKSRIHKRYCECKSCRDRRPAFPGYGTGRRYGYRGTPIQTRTAAIALDRLLQPGSMPNPQCQQSSLKPCHGKISHTGPPAVPRLGGGRLTNLQAGSNRFALLEVERTKDEVDYQPTKEICGDHFLRSLSSKHSAQSLVEDQDGSSEKSSTPYPLLPLNALLDSLTNSDLGKQLPNRQ